MVVGSRSPRNFDVPDGYPYLSLPVQGKDPSERRLPEWILIAYEVLESRIIDHDQGVSSEQEADRLLEETADEFALEPADAEYALQRLLDRGYLYEVDGVLFVTEFTDEE